MASPFASQTTSDPIPLPFDEGQWVQVRKLTGKEYEDAQTAHRREFVSNDKWAGFFRESMENPTAKAVKKALADPLTGFNRHAIVRAGLVAWSYPQSLKPLTITTNVDGKPGESSIDPLDDLDDDAIEFIAREVLRRTKPLLFTETREEVEDAKVKG